jgi:hypothetical protein
VEIFEADIFDTHLAAFSLGRCGPVFKKAVRHFFD